MDVTRALALRTAPGVTRTTSTSDACVFDAAAAADNDDDDDDDEDFSSTASSARVENTSFCNSGVLFVIVTATLTASVM
jgi:hypothetical protein